ncbi:ABC transporter ATP-binding protein [Massilia sp. W12]|uniref:ABC transporter ATP-binding protein n=1 Tax=Massilia sp. W12 TaxID=3126507 RepID=UPI0030CE9F87
MTIDTFPDSQAAPPALCLQGVAARFGAHSEQGLRAIDLRCEAGQVHVLAGPNGCGKSTLLRTIAGLHPLQSGQIRLAGQTGPAQALHSLTPKQRARLLAWMPQESGAPPEITVEELVRLGRHPHRPWHGAWRSSDQAAVSSALAACDIADLAARPLSELSGGQRQRAQLALALAQDTPILLLDEPTSMLDPGHQLDLLLRLRQLAKQGRCVLLVMHDIQAAARLADQLIAMRDGRIIAAGCPRRILQPDLLRQLYGIEVDLLQAPQDGAPIIAPRWPAAPALA